MEPDEGDTDGIRGVGLGESTAAERCTNEARITFEHSLLQAKTGPQLAASHSASWTNDLHRLDPLSSLVPRGFPLLPFLCWSVHPVRSSLPPLGPR